MVLATAPPDLAIRRGTPAEAALAVDILAEASAWAATVAGEVWTAAELDVGAFAAAATRGELVLGLAGARPVAIMLLQTEDRLYWPEMAPGSALYVHKVAVRREVAARGWLTRLLDYAQRDARDRGIGFLRLDTMPRPKLRAMYERHGFRVLDEPPPIVNGRPMLRLEKPLGRTA
ncbi:MAG: GNAT family N-acetyltransferase [Proteobacteria bacterium]|nr:GNAT family N-acetyltransferase [Pseudomonadota bacterium]